MRLYEGVSTKIGGDTAKFVVNVGVKGLVINVVERRDSVYAGSRGSGSVSHHSIMIY